MNLDRLGERKNRYVEEFALRSMVYRCHGGPGGVFLTYSPSLPVSLAQILDNRNMLHLGAQNPPFSQAITTHATRFSARSPKDSPSKPATLNLHRLATVSGIHPSTRIEGCESCHALSSHNISHARTAWLTRRKIGV
jgi:hypothetical protein